MVLMRKSNQGFKFCVNRFFKQQEKRICKQTFIDKTSSQILSWAVYKFNILEPELGRVDYGKTISINIALICICKKLHFLCNKKI